MSKFRFDLKARKVTRQLARVAYDIGVIAVHHSKNEVFPSKSWDGKAWKEKKKPDTWPLLEKTGKLRRSVRILRYNSKGVRWGSTLSYAGFHNYGTQSTPRRQFIGMDRYLRKRTKEKIAAGIKKGLIR